jgi:hypothetical protein
MFRGVINSAKNAASNLVVKYLARASVSVPFVLATGFALAGLTVMLNRRLGSLTHAAHSRIGDPSNANSQSAQRLCS